MPGFWPTSSRARSALNARLVFCVFLYVRGLRVDADNGVGRRPDLRLLGHGVS